MSSAAQTEAVMITSLVQMLEFCGVSFLGLSSLDIRPSAENAGGDGGLASKSEIPAGLLKGELGASVPGPAIVAAGACWSSPGLGSLSLGAGRGCSSVFAKGGFAGAPGSVGSSH